MGWFKRKNGKSFKYKLRAPKGTKLRIEIYSFFISEGIEFEKKFDENSGEEYFYVDSITDIVSFLAGIIIRDAELKEENIYIIDKEVYDYIFPGFYDELIKMVFEEMIDTFKGNWETRLFHQEIYDNFKKDQELKKQIEKKLGITFQELKRLFLL